MMRCSALLATLLVAPALANEAHHSPYAEETEREIKSLSAEDVRALQAGEGWGLARAAELNGVPGPAHILEMASELKLSAEQLDQITQLFQQMQKHAQDMGETLVQLERELDQGFAQRTLDKNALQSLLLSIGTQRARLRGVHLAAHLDTLDVLDATQVERYNLLRGYGTDPCSAVPAGHDATLWRKHNGCP